MNEKQNDVTTSAPSELHLVYGVTLSILGVREILSYDENSVNVALSDAELYLEGEDLKIVRMAPEDGSMLVSGSVRAAVFRCDSVRKKKGIGKIFR